MTYSSEVMADAPVVYYKLDETSGSPQDSSGNGNHASSDFLGTLGAAPLISTGTAMTCSGSNQGVYRPTTTAALRLSAGASRSFEVWFKSTQTTVGQLGYTSGGAGLNVRINTSSGKVSASWGSALADITSSASVTDGLPHHVVVTINATTVTLYVDGVAQGTQDRKADGSADPALYHGFNSSLGNDFAGTLDEVAWYATELSAARVSAHYAAGKPVTYSSEVLADSPVVYWKLDDSSGAPQDSSGNGWHGSPSYYGTWGVPALINAGTAMLCEAQYDGVYGATTIPALRLSAGASRSVELWMKSTQTTRGMLAATNGGSSLELSINDTAGSGKVTAAWGSASVVSTAVVNDGQRHHVVATITGSTLSLYVDSVLQGTAARATSASSDPRLFAGFTSSSNQFYGTLDEVSWYASALSSGRVQAHYSAGTDAPTISHVGTTVPATEDTAGSTVVAVPAGVQDGDLLVMAIRLRQPDTATAIPTPAGWTLTYQQVADVVTHSSTRRMRLAVFTRVASSEPASYTVSHYFTYRQGAMLAYRGAEIAGTAGAYQNEQSGTADPHSHSPSSVTLSSAVTNGKAVTVAACGYDVTAPAWNPSGIQRWDDRRFAADEVGVASASGTYTPSVLSHDWILHFWVGVTLVLKPKAAVPAQTVAVGKVTSASTATQVVVRQAQVVSVGKATASSAIGSVAAIKGTRTVPVGRASRASVSRPVSAAQTATRPIGRASRIVTARPITVQQTVPLKPYPTEVLDDGATLYWRLDQAGNALDATNNGRVGVVDIYTAGGGAQTVVSGIVGNAVHLNYAQYFYDASAAGDTFAVQNAYTLEVWFQFTGPGPTDTQVFLDFFKAGYNRTIGIAGGTTAALAVRWGSATGAIRSVCPITEVNDGAWHHVVMVMDTSDNRIRAYLDGVLRVDALITPVSQNGSFALAGGQWTPSFGWPTYDEIAYYPKALSATQVQRHYDSALTGPPAPVNVSPPLGRGVRASTPRAINPLVATPQVRTIGQASTSRTARPWTLAQGEPPGGPQILPVGRVTHTSLSRPFGILVATPQVAALAVAARTAAARQLVPSSVPPFLDTFNRPDSASAIGAPDAGGPYTVRSGTWGIEAGALKATNVSNSQVTFPVPESFDATITVKQVGTSCGFMWHWADTNNFSYVNWTSSQGLILWRCQGGTFNQQGVTGPRVVNGSKVRVRTTRDYSWVYLDGRLVASAFNRHRASAPSVAGYRFNGDSSSRWEEVSVRSDPLLSQVAGAEIGELGVAPVNRNNQGLIYKGRDVRFADEGALA